jgi:hypothetical protein
MGDRIVRSLATWLAVIVIVAACAKSAPDPVVDGWPIGQATDCAVTPCGAWLAVAQARLDVRDPGHAEVVKATLHNEGTLVAPEGGLQIFTRSGGCCNVALFELADGTTKALGVGTIGISTTVSAVDFGP